MTPLRFRKIWQASKHFYVYSFPLEEIEKIGNPEEIHDLENIHSSGKSQKKFLQLFYQDPARCGKRLNVFAMVLFPSIQLKKSEIPEKFTSLKICVRLSKAENK